MLIPRRNRRGQRSSPCEQVQISFFPTRRLQRPFCALATKNCRCAAISHSSEVFLARRIPSLPRTYLTGFHGKFAGANLRKHTLQEDSRRKHCWRFARVLATRFLHRYGTHLARQLVLFQFGRSCLAFGHVFHPIAGLGAFIVRVSQRSVAAGTALELLLLLTRCNRRTYFPTASDRVRREPVAMSRARCWFCAGGQRDGRGDVGPLGSGSWRRSPTCGKAMKKAKRGQCGGNSDGGFAAGLIRCDFFSVSAHSLPA